MTEVANRVAQDLDLPEHMPITRSNLVKTFVSPPGLYIHRSQLGYVETINYAYCFTAGRTASEVVQKRALETFHEAKLQYTWPVQRLDTNAALKMAAGIMAAARVDVAALNRDCSVEVMASMTEGQRGKHFVPDYWVDWRKPGTNVAHLEFLLPTRSIRSLNVYESSYLLRKPIEIPNLVDLLAPENPPDAVLREWELATNAAKLREFLIQSHAPQSLLKKAGGGATNSPPLTNAAAAP